MGCPPRGDDGRVAAHPADLDAQGPTLGQSWLHYADGTELLVEERVLGPLGFLAVDLALHGPTPKLSINPRADDCWVSVGRKDTRLRLLDGRHPLSLIHISEPTR